VGEDEEDCNWGLEGLMLIKIESKKCKFEYTANDDDQDASHLIRVLEPCPLSRDDFSKRKICNDF
jgi:hypothetical protein